jgi:hypothetical protein
LMIEPRLCAVVSGAASAFLLVFPLARLMREANGFTGHRAEYRRSEAWC